MATHSAALSRPQNNGLLAVAAGGLIAGSLDLTQALILFGRRVPLAIAGGLLGRQAFQGGAGVYVLGVLLHFFIAFSIATIYYAASRKLIFFDRASAGVRFVLRHGRGTGHELCCLAAVGASRPGSLPAS